MLSSANHYRRGLLRLPGVAEFRSNNIAHRPVIEALDVIVRHSGATARFYPPEEPVGCSSTVLSAPTGRTCSSPVARLPRPPHLHRRPGGSVSLSTTVPTTPSSPPTDPPVTAPGAVAGRMRFSVDGWDPTYGTSLEPEDDLGESSAEVIVDIELPAAQWRPIEVDRTVTLPAAALFVDGVRRVEARAWIDEVSDGAPATEASAALCASYAAGVVCCCESQAHLLAIEARRGLFTIAPHALDISTSAGVYHACHTPPSDVAPLTVTLSAALQRRLAKLELAAANARPRRARRPRRRRGPRSACHRRPTAQPDAPSAHDRLHQEPPQRLPAVQTARDGGRARWRPAHAGVSHGHHLGAPRVVLAAAVQSRLALGRRRPHRVLGGPAESRGDPAGEPEPGDAVPVCLAGVQGRPGAAESLPDRRPGASAAAPAW